MLANRMLSTSHCPTTFKELGFFLTQIICMTLCVYYAFTLFIYLFIYSSQILVYSFHYQSLSISELLLS